LLARLIIKPIKELTEAAAQLEAGDLSHRVSVDRADEIGQLAAAFNAMAGSLERQETLRRNMTSDIAHELRTPLANLYGYLEAIEDGLVNPDPAAIHSLMEETELLNQLVEDLQEISLADAGELRLDIQPTTLEAIIHATIETLRPTAQSKSIALQVDLPDDLPQAAADPRRLAQILRNLLNNSLTHTPEYGRIVLSAESIEATSVPSMDKPGRLPSATPSSATSRFIQFQIHDNGPGIEPEHQALVFHRFYRADAARARTTGGSGLGLAISKMLVEAQGGEIWLKSIVGAGTVVGFTLPLANGRHS
ncbi:MAG: ATP-binding protein, partial [Candidatus Promineifilaceae bacterium]|nr:ATP-binding protein [Candidatus Promineifilaceae bacterium]